MAVHQTGSQHRPPAVRWRPPSYAEEQAARSVIPAAPEPLPPVQQAPVEDDDLVTVTIRVSRSTLSSLLNHTPNLNQEHHMSKSNSPAVALAATNNEGNQAVAALEAHAADLAAQAATLAAQQNNVADSLAALKGTGAAEVAATAKVAGKRNVGKVVGKIAIGTGIVGVLGIAAVYGFRAYQTFRG